MSKESDKRQKAIISAQGQLDSAPAMGKGTYLKKLPEPLRLFVPEKNKTYRAVFLPWKGGKHHPLGQGNWVTNYFFFVHQVGVNFEKYLCSMKHFNKPCAVDEKIQALRPTVNRDQFSKILGPLMLKNRELIFLHLLNEPKSLYVWDESCFLFGDNFRLKYQKKPSWMGYADFECGSIIEFQGREKKMGGSGSCVECGINIEIEERTEPLDPFLVKAAHTYCIDDLILETPYEKLKKLVGGTPAPVEEPEQPMEEGTVEEDMVEEVEGTVNSWPTKEEPTDTPEEPAEEAATEEESEMASEPEEAATEEDMFQEEEVTEPEEPQEPEEPPPPPKKAPPKAAPAAPSKRPTTPPSPPRRLATPPVPPKAPPGNKPPGKQPPRR